jgi:hypothetical protein
LSENIFSVKLGPFIAKNAQNGREKISVTDSRFFVHTDKCQYGITHGIGEKMSESTIPMCDKSHEPAEMRKVWADGHGDAVYQCPICGRKTQVKE